MQKLLRPPYILLKGCFEWNTCIFAVFSTQRIKTRKHTDFEFPPLIIHNAFYADLGFSFTLNLAQQSDS